MNFILHLGIIVGMFFIFAVVVGIIVGALSVFYPELDTRKPFPKFCICVIAVGITALLLWIIF